MITYLLPSLPFGCFPSELPKFCQTELGYSARQKTPERSKLQQKPSQQRWLTLTGWLPDQSIDHCACGIVRANLQPRVRQICNKNLLSRAGSATADGSVRLALRGDFRARATTELSNSVPELMLIF